MSDRIEELSHKTITLMVAALISILFAVLASPAIAGDDLDDAVVRDAAGHRTATIERDPVFSDQHVIRNDEGKKIGTIEPDPVFKGVLIERDDEGRKIGTIERR
jgi:hypothetical protein